MTDIFNGEAAPAAAATPPAEVVTKPEDLLKSILNESGEQKYKSVEDALIALDHSQKYIPQLKHQLTDNEQKLKDLEEKVGKFGNIEETVQRLLAKEPTPAVTPPAASGLDEQAVRKLLADQLQAERVNATLSANQQKVNDTLVSKFGDKALDALEAKAAELKTSRQALGELAKQNPDLVLALFASAPHKDPNPSTSGRRTPDPVRVVDPLKKPERSLLSGPGANVRDQGERFALLRQQVHKDWNVES